MKWNKESRWSQLKKDLLVHKRFYVRIWCTCIHWHVHRQVRDLPMWGNHVSVLFAICQSAREPSMDRKKSTNLTFFVQVTYRKFWRMYIERQILANRWHGGWCLSILWFYSLLVIDVWLMQRCVSFHIHMEKLANNSCEDSSALNLNIPTSFNSITVRIQDQLSSHHIIQNGIPQGDVWSVPLFLIAINDITKCVAFPLTQRILADDFSISF